MMPLPIKTFVQKQLKMEERNQTTTFNLGKMVGTH